MLRLVLGLIPLFVAGEIVPWLVNWATDHDKPSEPEGMHQDLWSNIMARGSAGAVLGHLERLLFFAAFLQDVPVVVAGWLAFKVASGWQNWKLIVQLPDDIQGINKLDYLRARSQLGSWIFHRFLIGTLGNVLVALVAVAFAKWICS